MNSISSVITTRNLGKTYKEKVLNNINLDIQAGEIIGYIGPNGAPQAWHARRRP